MDGGSLWPAYLKRGADPIWRGDNDLTIVNEEEVDKEEEKAQSYVGPKSELSLK